MRTPLVPSKVSRVKRCRDVCQVCASGLLVDRTLVPTSEDSGIFSVGVAMRTRAVECYEGAFQSSPLLYDGKKG